MRMQSSAHVLLMLLVGVVLVGSVNLSRAAAAGNSEFPMTHSNGALVAPLAVFTVTNLNDSGTGSLRQAVANANMSPGADLITFGVTGTITLTTGELLITESLTILGPGATFITVSGNHTSRVFHIVAGVTATISDLTISDGSIAPRAGGGIFNDGGTVTITNSTVTGNAAGGGGGIGSSGTITITNSTVSSNSATVGGGINGFGTTTITNSTVSSNFASVGGGISNEGGVMTIINTTVSSNSANTAGAIDSANFNTTTNITNSTLANNAAFNVGGIRYRSANIKNSILANTTVGGNCFGVGTLTASGINFSIDNSCTGFTQVTQAQLNLGPLTNNGGPTQTHALFPGSVAIDAVTDCTDLSAAPVTTDQRGVSRPLDGDGDGVARCDAGAYEAPAVASFDLCIQDESSGYILKINSTTGAYQFTTCSGFTLGGTGSLIVRGSTITFQDNRADRKVLAKIDTSAHKGTASVQVFGQGTTYNLTDRNTANNTCACTAQ